MEISYTVTFAGLPDDLGQVQLKAIDDFLEETLQSVLYDVEQVAKVAEEMTLKVIRNETPQEPLPKGE